MPSGDAGAVECSSKPSHPPAAPVGLASPTEAVPPKDEGKKKKPEKKGIARVTIKKVVAVRFNVGVPPQCFTDNAL